MIRNCLESWPSICLSISCWDNRIAWMPRSQPRTGPGTPGAVGAWRVKGSRYRFLTQPSRRLHKRNLTTKRWRSSWIRSQKEITSWRCRSFNKKYKHASASRRRRARTLTLRTNQWPMTFQGLASAERPISQIYRIRSKSTYLWIMTAIAQLQSTLLQEISPAVRSPEWKNPKLQNQGPELISGAGILTNKLKI